MGSRAAGKRQRRLRALPLIAASLIMVLAAVPAALAAQATEGGPAEPVAPPDQPEPVEGPPGDASGVCDHAPGEFLVGYVSEEALQAAPSENVAGTLGGIAQHLVFEEIKNIPNPAERLAAEEAKRQELSARPGVAYAEYNCVATTQEAASAERAADLPAPASCGDCGRYVVDRAKKIIAEGFGGAEGSDAFEAALQAARSVEAGDDKVAFASEIELDDEDGASSSSADEDDASSSSDDSSTDDSSADEGGASENSASDDDDTEGSGSGEKDADDDESDTEEEAGDEVSSSKEDTEVGSEGEETGPDPETVSGKNAAATSEPRETGGSGGKVMALGAGALLLAAGVFVARRAFWS